MTGWRTRGMQYILKECFLRISMAVMNTVPKANREGGDSFSSYGL